MQDTTWLTIDEAARRSGRNPGGLRRRAATELLGKGMARLVSGGGKRPYYEIREDADPDFARVKTADQMGNDLRDVSESARAEAIRRRQVLHDWAKAKTAAFTLGYDADAATGRFLQQLLLDRNVTLSRATLYNWDRKFRAEGLIGLVDARSSRSSHHSSPAAENPFIEEVKRYYLTPRKIKLTTCIEMATLSAAERGWDVLSYSACNRAIKAIPPAVVLKKRHGEEAFVNRAEPYIERDYTSLASNELWCGDHHQFDVAVSDGGKICRPWLTAWQDMRSRKIVGCTVFNHAPNTDTILYAFRQACRDFGLPLGVYVDNGKDYDSYALNGRTKADRWKVDKIKADVDVARVGGVWTQLGIEIKHALPYHGQSKPIERFFGTLEQSTRVWETYCGNSTAERHRMSHPQDPQNLQLQIERGKSPSLADFSLWFDEWVKGHNATASLASGLSGKSPDVVFTECLYQKRTATEEVIDALCLRRLPKCCKIGQNGVTFKGLRFGQFEPALQQRLGQEVELRVDDNDLSSVQVWTMDGKFICMAGANKQLPFNATSEELREATRQKKQARKAVTEYFDQRPRMGDDLPDAIIRARAARIAAEQAALTPDSCPPTPPSLLPIRTAIDDQLPAVRRAYESRELRATGTDDATAGSRFIMSQHPALNTRDSEDEPAPISFREAMSRRNQTQEED